MQDYEVKTMKLFINDIQDKLDALRVEVNSKTPYPRYCLEKLEPIRMNVNCLISILENKLIKNEPSNSDQTENR